ncbi:uncharacterized protein LOC128740580 [Sabethes cyaneus]|uniref:uncharacterized protein LOC128740580 n=1 Tax=Sabethes cyaneus TaxID=53552 RepID=UPI00237D38D9|nr:uncharacterized protein LOC128740580 [Sabethes cyaneus]
MMLRTMSWLLTLFLVSAEAVPKYQCLESSTKYRCVIEYVTYHPGQRISFPSGYQHFRIGTANASDSLESNITTLDEALYAAMDHPAIIEMEFVKMWRLVLPSDLAFGNFANNGIHSLDIDPASSYRITYLDLHSNLLSNVANISALDKLETLRLERNYIQEIDASTVSALAKLKRLNLKGNHLRSFPWHALPCTLVHLDISRNRLESVNLTNLRFPALEYINLAKNDIYELNVTDILRAAPNLKEAYLFNHQIPTDDMGGIASALHERRILFSEIDEEYCLPNEDYIDGRCVKRIVPRKPKYTWKTAVVAVCVLTGISVLGYLIYLAYLRVIR